MLAIGGAPDASPEDGLETLELRKNCRVGEAYR